VKRTVLLIAALASLASVADPASAQEPGREPDLRLQFKEIPLERVDRELVPALADPNRTISVMVEMARDPVAVEREDALEAGAPLAKSQETKVQQDLESAQDAIVPKIRELGGRVQSQLQHAFNGMRVAVPAGQVQQLAKLPGVVAVHPIKVAKPDNVITNLLLQTPSVWEDLGFTGKGVKVGIVDRGIDY
jgi:minor extracellular serine protease Vpr